MALPELRRVCEVCRHRVLMCVRLHTEADEVVSRFGGSAHSYPAGTVVCMRCVDANAHICLRSHPLPIARAWVKCKRCGGSGAVMLDRLTGHWRRTGERAREVRCRVCSGRGEIPG